MHSTQADMVYFVWRNPLLAKDFDRLEFAEIANEKALLRKEDMLNLY